MKSSTSLYKLRDVLVKAGESMHEGEVEEALEESNEPAMHPSSGVNRTKGNNAYLFHSY